MMKKILYPFAIIAMAGFEGLALFLSFFPGKMTAEEANQEGPREWFVKEEN